MLLKNKLPFYWIDVFTNKPLSGNPCAVILGADNLDTLQMQRIAKEMNLSETAFVMSSKIADFRARYFTPSEELPFAGHPTIAVIKALIESDLIQIQTDMKKVSLEVNAGVIPVEILASNGRRQFVVSQLKPIFLRCYDPAEILPIYGLSEQDLLPGAPIQTVSTGSPVLLIPLRSHDALKRIRYADFERCKAIKAQGDFLFPHHFCLQGVTVEGATLSRSLGTPPNTLEDSFTGSASGCMAAYLWKYGLVKTHKFIIEQGHWMGRPGRAEVEVIDHQGSIETVKLSGEAVSLIKGEINHL